MSEGNPYPPPLEVTVARMDAEARATREVFDARLEAVATALELQAKEYERRLSDLNHAHAQREQRERTYVTLDKYEDKVEAEAKAREIALDRLDEKHADLVKRYELRQREIDLANQAHENALKLVQAEAARAAQDAKDQAAASADAAKAKADAVERRANRNLVIAGLLISTIAIGASLLQNL